MAIETITIDDIEVNVNTDLATDYEVLKICATLSKPLPKVPSKNDKNYKVIVKEFDKQAEQRGYLTFRIVELVLGDQESKISDTIRANNNGICTGQDILGFVDKVLSAIKTDTSKK